MCRSFLRFGPTWSEIRNPWSLIIVVEEEKEKEEREQERWYSDRALNTEALKRGRAIPLCVDYQQNIKKLAPAASVLEMFRFRIFL